MIKKIKKNKACPNCEERRGFALLFAVTLAGIILAIAVGVANIALKEVKFTTSAKDSNNAFYAADTAIEYALWVDKPSKSTCAELSTGCNFTVAGLGSTGTSCAIVAITKDNSNPPYTTTSITSKGYNIGDVSCASTNPNRIERELVTTYGGLAAQNVIWNTFTAVGVSISGNSLTKTAATGWGNAGAVSTQTILLGDGYVEFSTNENDHGHMAGLNNGDPDQNYTSIDFAINADALGQIKVFENGTQIGPILTNYVAGDVFRVSVESGTVKYYKNGTLLYTSSATLVYPLLLDTALNHSGGTVTNAKISF